MTFDMPNVDELRGARVYADALWNLAQERGEAAAIVEELESLVAQVLDPHPEFETFLKVAAIARDRRAEMIDRVFGGRTSSLMGDFLRTLDQRDRLGLLRSIGFCLRQIADRASGVVPVLARSAVPLGDEQRTAIERMVRERLGGEPRLEVQTDPELLGGLWIRIGDTVYDDSVRAHLGRLRDNILTRSAHEIRSQ